MRIVAVVAILGAAAAAGPRAALAQTNSTLPGAQPAAVTQPQPRVYYFDLTGGGSPPTAPQEAQPATFQQAAPLEWRAGGPASGRVPPPLAVDDPSMLISRGIYALPPVWETVPSWDFHSFAHTSCMCPTYGDDPWQCYCEHRQRCRRSYPREQCHYLECRRDGRRRFEPAPCSRAPACLDASGDESILIRREAPRALGPTQESAPGPRRLPNNELPTPADQGGSGHDQRYRAEEATSSQPRPVTRKR